MSRILVQSLRMLIALSVINLMAGSMDLNVEKSVLKQTCRSPDVPAKGQYIKILVEENEAAHATTMTDEKEETAEQPSNTFESYHTGDAIVYSCKPGFVLRGSRKRTCTSSGEWSGSTPFCDKPINVTDVWMINDNSGEVKKIIDGNRSSCYFWNTTKSDDIQIPLHSKCLVRAVRIYQEGPHIMSARIPKFEKCGMVEAERSSGIWIKLQCTEDQNSVEFVSIKADSRIVSNIFLCEVQIFSSDGCDNPPNFYVSNGHLEIGRKRANFLCDPGYKAKSGSLICEDNIWKAFNLECVDEETTKNSAIIIIAVAMGVCLILFLIAALIIYRILRKRSRGPTVIYKANTDGSTASLSEYEYNEPIYEPIKEPPIPVSRPRIPPDQSYGYFLPHRSSTLSHTTSDRSSVFGTFKPYVTLGSKN